MKKNVWQYLIVLLITIMLLPSTVFAGATGDGDSNQDIGGGWHGKDSGFYKLGGEYLTAFRFTIVDSEGKRIPGTHSTDFYNQEDYANILKLSSVYCSINKKARNEVKKSMNMTLCGTQTANKLSTNAVNDKRMDNLPKIFKDRSSNNKDYVEDYILPKINALIKGEDLSDLNKFFKERFNYEYSKECTKKEHFILVEPISYLRSETHRYYLGTATELENVVTAQRGNWWAITGVGMYFNLPYSLYIQTEGTQSYFDRTQHTKFTGFHPLPTRCNIVGGYRENSVTRTARCLQINGGHYSYLNNSVTLSGRNLMYAHSMGLINIAENMPCNDTQCSDVIAKSGLGNEVEKNGVLWERQKSNPAVSDFDKATLEKQTKTQVEKWVRDNISVCYERTKLNCRTVTVKDFEANKGEPNLGRGAYTEQTYQNINSRNSSWGAYYLKHCPKITCANYDGTIPINSKDNDKFNKSKFDSLTNPEHKKHYLDNCPCYCDDYNNDLFEVGCKLPANPPGGKYESDIASNLNDEAYRKYIAHCPPCRPCDPEVEVCDSACNLVSKCPEPNKESGVSGYIRQNNIIDRQACADSAYITGSAANSLDFVVDLGSKYCKAACTYDVDELNYPGARLGLGSGRFIRFDDVSIKMKTTCTTSQIDYDLAQADLNKATTASQRNNVISNINKCLDLSSVKRPRPIIDFEYKERDTEGFEIGSTQTTTSYTYCRNRLRDNRCYDIASGPQNMAQTILSGTSLERSNNTTTAVFTDTYKYRPATVYYSTFYEAKILKNDAGAKQEAAGKAIKIDKDGRVFPINFDTAPGTYPYSLKTDLNEKTLKDLQAKYAKKGTCSLDYTCYYKVHKVQCVEPCDEVDDKTYESGINANFRFVSNNDINPNNRVLGINWRDDNAKARETISEIENLGDEVYNNENLEYSFTLTPSVMNKIRKLNADAEAEGGYANDTLTCKVVDSTTGYYICKSDWLNSVFDKNTYQIKNDDQLFTSYVDGTPWK